MSLGDGLLTSLGDDLVTPLGDGLGTLLEVDLLGGSSWLEVG